MIILTDFQVAIAAIKKAEKTRKVRTRELKKVMRKIEKGKRALGPKAFNFRWVKSYVGIKGNEEADKGPN